MYEQCDKLRFFLCAVSDASSSVLCVVCVAMYRSVRSVVCLTLQGVLELFSGSFARRRTMCALPQQISRLVCVACFDDALKTIWLTPATVVYQTITSILAEGAIALPVTLSGGVLFAS